MKRMFVVAIGVSVMGAAAWLLFSQVLPPPHLPDSAKAEIPLSLRQRADCMYQALKGIRGVDQPVLRYENRGGWNHPVLGYLAAWRDGMYQMTFEAQKPVAGHGTVWFLHSFSGPPPPGLDTALIESVMKNWKARCQAAVDFEIN